MTPPETDGYGNVAPLVAAAEQALSRALDQPVRLGDVAALTEPGRRNVLLRCRNLSGGTPSSVVIKHAVMDDGDAQDAASWDVRRFLNDWAGAAFLSSLPGTSCCSPRFYAGDRDSLFFILEDLGPHRSLVEPLLEEDAASATAALCAFAVALGQTHAATIGQSRVFERLCQTLHPSGLVSGHAVATFSGAATRLHDAFERLAIDVDARFQEEVAVVAGTMADPAPFLAYIHGDACPDNVAFTGTHVRLIDFEFGRFGHALLDAVYGRMMFPTCWCANRLPPAVVAEMESRYRAELVTGCPEAQDDRVFESALVRACAFWMLSTLDRQLAGALENDRQWGIATMRPRLLARLAAFITAAETFHALPAVRGTASRLLEVLHKRWPEASPLPLYPAFLGEDAVSQA